MTIPGSAADLPNGKKEVNEDECILALVKGEKITLTRKQAFALASQLIISLEVFDV